jgi:tRNA threonylcarbamoyladenosine biosynthesis protein TsaB
VNPLILAVDTTHETGGLALACGDEILEEVELHSPTGFAHVLYGHLRDLLDRHRVSVRDVDCFASASGPGSFTGVRVGLACVKGLAEAACKPVVAVSNLQAMAWHGTAPLRAVVMDARRGEVYGAVYDDRLQPVSPEVVMKLAAWLESLPGEVEFISADMELPVSQVIVPRGITRAIAAIAVERYRRGESQDPAALDANYVRRSDAELFWKE